MAPKRKLIELSNDKKYEILNLIRKGESQRKLADRYGISKTTVSNISKNGEEITKLWLENCGGDRKRKLRKTSNEEINFAVWEFFKLCRSKNIPVSGPMLQAKAKEISNELGISEFNASNGWLESFRLRNNINFRTLCGESASADCNAAEDWKAKLPVILKNYPPEDQFNADETGLFFRQLPTKSLVSKSEKCFGGKMPKERLTVLLCCSVTGEKLKPVVIGNAANPRAFKRNGVKVQNLPVTWKYNKKAWMNSSIFEEWLRDINSQMKNQRRRIILFIDNVSSHIISKSFTNIKIVFLPPNLTSLVQPLDQGIICAVKLHYRKLMLKCLITKIEHCNDVSDFTKSVNVFDAIRWLNDAWKNLPSSTISKSFYKAGFKNVDEISNEEETEFCLNSDIQTLPVNIQQELVDEKSFLSFDNDIAVHEEVEENAEDIAANILAKMKKPLEIEDNQDEDSEEETVNENTRKTPLTFSEALDCVQNLMCYASDKQPDISEKIMDLHVCIEKHWADVKSKNQRQTTMRDFFFQEIGNVNDKLNFKNL